jgi:hypothetical protein
MVHSCALSRTFFAQYRLLFLEAPRKMRPYLDPRGRRTFQNQHAHSRILVQVHGILLGIEPTAAYSA